VDNTPLETILPTTDWKTADVLGLARTVWSTRDAGLLPVLADAMQEGGYPEDDPLLARMRSGAMGEVRASRLACLVLGGDKAEAVKRIEDFAVNFLSRRNAYDYAPDSPEVLRDPNYYNQHVGYDRLMRDAGENLDQGSSCFLPFDFPDELYTRWPAVLVQFWKDYREVMNANLSDDDIDGMTESAYDFFHCSC